MLVGKSFCLAKTVQRFFFSRAEKEKKIINNINQSHIIVIITTLEGTQTFEHNLLLRIK